MSEHKTDETPGEYVTDALEMIGAREPRTIERRNGFAEPTYTQTPNDLFDELLPDMGLAELKIVMVIVRHTFGYHRDEIKLSIRKLAEMTGLSTNSVISGAELAESHGLLEKWQDGNKTTLWRMNVSVIPSKTRRISRLDAGVSPAETLLGVKETNKEKQTPKVQKSKLPANSDMAFLMAAGMTSAEIAASQTVSAREQAVANFYESVMSYNPLPWWTDNDLGRLLRFLIDKPETEIVNFAEWSKAKFSTFSPAKARMSPMKVIEFWPLAQPTTNAARTMAGEERI
jgi:hypothetical protein